MHPILLKLGPITLYTYGLMLVVAFIVAAWLASRAAQALPRGERAMTAEQTLDLACVSLLGGIVGARLLYAVLYFEAFAAAPLEFFAIWHGGLVWYGGFLGGLAAGVWYARAKGFDALRAADQLIPFVALGHALGRIGCFLNGCCYGDPTTAWCGVVFPGQQQAVLPTQLFEALGLLAIYVVLRMLQRSLALRARGRLLGWYLVSYGALRFGLEFLRGDQEPWWMGLTLQQCISIGIVLAGAWLTRPRRRA